MNANTRILDRELARQSFAAAAGTTTAIFRDIVDEGTWLLARVEQTAAGGASVRHAHVALVRLLRHALSLADGVDELIRARCVRPAMLQVRAILEARMQLLYLLGERSPYSPNPLEPGDVDAVPRDASSAALAGAALEAVRDERGGAYWVAEIRQQRRTAEGLGVHAQDEPLVARLAARMRFQPAPRTCISADAATDFSSPTQAKPPPPD